MTSTRLTATAAATAIAALAANAQSADPRPEIINLIAFDMVDFVGWNNADMDLMRRYHADGVAVDMAGLHTDGIDSHVEMLEQILASGTAPKIVQHMPKVAQGEWTAVVGIMTEGTMATVAKWKDGAMTEEYLFLRPMTSAELDLIEPSEPFLILTTPDDPNLRSVTGAQPGWTAEMWKDHAIFTQTIGGKVVERLAFGI